MLQTFPTRLSYDMSFGSLIHCFFYSKMLSVTNCFLKPTEGCGVSPEVFPSIPAWAESNLLEHAWNALYLRCLHIRWCTVDSRGVTGNIFILTDFNGFT